LSSPWASFAESGHVTAGLGPAIHDNALAVRRLDVHRKTGFDRVVEIGDQLVHRFALRRTQRE
jgi:hypothetical protein